MRLLSWIAVIVCLTGSFLNARKIKFCFILWIIGNALWILYDFITGLYSRMFLDIVQLCISAYGMKKWNEEK